MFHNWIKRLCEFLRVRRLVIQFSSIFIEFNSNLFRYESFFIVIFVLHLFHSSIFNNFTHLLLHKIQEKKEKRLMKTDNQKLHQ